MALGIHQRAAGIARIDRGVRLDDVEEGGVSPVGSSLFRPLTMPMLMLSGKWPSGQPKAKQSSQVFTPVCERRSGATVWGRCAAQQDL